MTSTLIAPVIPSPVQHHARVGNNPPGADTPGRLPVPALTRPRLRSTVFGLASLDCNGRIADNHLLRALGWDTAARLDIPEQGRLLLITATDQGLSALPEAVTCGYRPPPGGGAAWAPATGCC